MAYAQRGTLVGEQTLKAVFTDAMRWQLERILSDQLDGGEAAGGDNGSGRNSPNEQANEQDKKRAKKSDDDKEKPPGRGGKGRDDR